MQVPVQFPTEADALRQQCEVERHLSPEERLRAAVDAARAGDVLSQAGQVRLAQLRYQQELEEDWVQRMKEFIKQHVSS